MVSRGDVVTPAVSSAVTYAFTADCTACGACLLTCPEHAIVAGLPLRVREDRCTACGECLEVCPADAVVELARDHAVGAQPVSAGGVSSPHDRGGVGVAGVVGVAR